MIKKLAIVSLSAGVLGEDFVQHELKIGLKRLTELGLEVSFMPNALKGSDYLKRHPEARPLAATILIDSYPIYLKTESWLVLCPKRSSSVSPIRPSIT